MIRITTKRFSAPLPWWKSISVEPVVFLYVLAIYIAIPTDEALLYREICSKFYNLSLCHSINRMKRNQTNIIHSNMEDIEQKYASKIFS